MNEFTLMLSIPTTSALSTKLVIYYCLIAKQIGELAGLGEGKPQRPLPDTATFEVTA